MTEPRLLTKTSFVVTATPNAFGRALLRLVKHVDTDARHWVRDRSGEPIATVAFVISRLRKALDGYTRHGVLDPSETKVLALRAGPRTLIADDADGNEIGRIHNSTRRGRSQLDSPSTPASRRARASGAAGRRRSATSCPGRASRAARTPTVSSRSPTPAA